MVVFVYCGKPDSVCIVLYECVVLCVCVCMFVFTQNIVNKKLVVFVRLDSIGCLYINYIKDGNTVLIKSHAAQTTRRMWERTVCNSSPFFSFIIVSWFLAALIVIHFMILKWVLCRSLYK